MPPSIREFMSGSNGSPRKVAKWPVVVGIVERVQAQAQALASLGGDEPSRGFERQVLDSLRARDRRYRWKGGRGCTPFVVT